MDAVRLAQAPVLQDWRRNVASTVVILTLGTLLVAGGADWSYRSICSWAYSKVNTNISLPMTNWQLEVRMRWVKTEPAVPATIHELFQQQPIKTKLYSVGLLCSPRWALIWAWLFDRDPALKLLHQHIGQHQSNGMDYLRSIVAALVPELLPEFVLEATADSGPLMQLLRKVAALHSSFLFWLAWLLCPGLQTAYYMFFFASTSPLKCAYATLIGLARTAVEVSAMLKCLQALWKGDKAAVVNSVVCCYLLPFIMTLQSISVLLLFCVCLPSWVTHIAMVAFCLWGPPVMIALMTTAWQPDRNRHALRAEPPAGFAAGGAAAAGPDAAVGAAHQGQHDQPNQHHQQRNLNTRLAWGRRAESVYWPPPLVVPEQIEELCSVPHYFMCPITHSIMQEPAVTITGATYERTAILEWLKAQRRDPLTSTELRPEQISPNLALYRAIDEWLQGCRVQFAAAKVEAQAQQGQQQELEQMGGEQMADGPAGLVGKQQLQQPSLEQHMPRQQQHHMEDLGAEQATNARDGPLPLGQADEDIHDADDGQ